jgi:hypothetical protein
MTILEIIILGFCGVGFAWLCLKWIARIEPFEYDDFVTYIRHCRKCDQEQELIEIEPDRFAWVPVYPLKDIACTCHGDTRA